MVNLTVAASSSGIGELITEVNDEPSSIVFVVIIIVVAILFYFIGYKTSFKQVGNSLAASYMGMSFAFVGLALVMVVMGATSFIIDPSEELEEHAVANIEENIVLSDLHVMETDEEEIEDRKYSVTVRGQTVDNEVLELTMSYEENFDMMMPVKTVETQTDIPVREGSNLEEVLNS